MSANVDLVHSILELAHVVTLENGKTRRIQECFDRDEALRVLGLQEEAMSQIPRLRSYPTRDEADEAVQL